LTCRYKPGLKHKLGLTGASSSSFTLHVTNFSFPVPQKPMWMINCHRAMPAVAYRGKGWVGVGGG